MSHEITAARATPIADMFTLLAGSPRTSDRSFVDVLAEAISPGVKPKMHARYETVLQAARATWGQAPCSAVTTAAFEGWLATLSFGQRVLPVGLLFGAASRVRLLDAGFGSRVIAGGFYANPVWAVQTATGAAGGVVGILAVGAASATLRASGNRGGAGTVAATLKRVLEKNQYIWVTDTHLVFVKSTGTQFAGQPVVRAAVPLADIAGIKKAPRYQMLLRFSLRFTDDSRASFMSMSRHYAGLRAALTQALSSLPH